MRVVPLLLLLLTCVWVVTGGASATSLEDLRWKHRILLVFPGDADAAGLVRTLEEQGGAVRERDLAWFVFADGDPSNTGYVLDARQRRRLEERFGAGGTRVVLIGKDGGVKDIADRLDLARTFATIDAMPMRRREMRQSGDAGPPVRT